MARVGAVRIAMVQLAVNEAESVSARIERALRLTEATAREADMVVLPELWPTGAFDLTLGLQNAQQLNCALVGQLAEVASGTNSWIHGGSFVEVDAHGAFYNTSVLFNPDGALAATYRKIHLFGFDSGEAAVLSSGTELVVVDTPLGPTGLATCYDLRFPEMYRALIDRGATALLMASGWPAARISHWEVLAKARAIEAQAWLLGCNGSGHHGGLEMGGNSIVVDPWGEVTAQAAQPETVLFADIDPDLPAQVRDKFPALRDRRLS